MKISKIAIACILVVLIIIALGIYKFNYLSSKAGHDVDGNKIERIE